jgi:hypothetical protein
MSQAGIAGYYSGWQTQPCICETCGWTGLGADCAVGRVRSQAEERVCPRCRALQFSVGFPAVEEMRANWAKLSQTDRIHLLVLDGMRAQAIESEPALPLQLPELAEEDLVLLWDIEDRERGGDTLIRYGERVIWREPAIFEGYRRFVEVARLLRGKYGSRLRDLLPTRRSEPWLYGDALHSPGVVENNRKDIFGG